MPSAPRLRTAPRAAKASLYYTLGYTAGLPHVAAQVLADILLAADRRIAALEARVKDLENAETARG